MKKSVKVGIYAIGCVIILACFIMCVNVYVRTNEVVDKVYSEIEETNELERIAMEWGPEAYNAYIGVDEEFEEYGGIGTYWFEYWSDTLRIVATSVDRNLTTSAPVSYYN